MPYQSGDDPRLLADLRMALKRWHRSTLGSVPLALCLSDVERRLAANPRLTRATALQQSIRAALAWLSHSDQADLAQLLERRYCQDQSVYRLQEVYHLGERSLYYRLEEAIVALAQALWLIEQGQERAAPALHVPPGSLPAEWRARHLPPPTYTRLFGVQAVLDELLDRLHDREEHWLISLEGMGGLGKTALAREAAGRLTGTNRFADIAWLAVSPYSYPSPGAGAEDQAELACAELLAGMARQLGGLDVAPLPFPAKRQTVHSLLQAQPCLVVVDNLETVMDCGALPGWFGELANPGKFLFTSRHRLEPDGGLSVLRLDQLPEAEALALIRHEGQVRDLPEVVDSSDRVLCSILDVTGGNPLAIKLVVGQLASLPLSHVLNGLKNVENGSDRLYQHLFGTTWSLLSVPARQLLGQMARLPEGGGTWEQLSALSSLSDELLAPAVVELTAHSLVHVAGLETKWYCLHPLTCHFVLHQAA